MRWLRPSRKFHDRISVPDSAKVRRTEYWEDLETKIELPRHAALTLHEIAHIAQQMRQAFLLPEASQRKGISSPGHSP